jgi:hypothetical protein
VGMPFLPHERRKSVTRTWRAVRDFMYGLSRREFVDHAVRMKHETEVLFLLATFGDLASVPVIPPVFSLRLLPYVLPEIETWKRQIVRRPELWEKAEFELHSV